MKRRLRTLGALLLCAPVIAFGSTVDDSAAVERVGVIVRGLTICHQHEWRHLSIELEYEAQQASEPAVRGFIRTFLKEYSQPDDFWEVMNTKFVHSLVETFPDMSYAQSTLTLSPDRTLSFPRGSIVTYKENSEALHESFCFTKLNYHGLELRVIWDLKENPGPFDYPDYQWIDAALESYFETHPLSCATWESLKPGLLDHLLEKFPTLASIEIELIVVS